MWVCVPIPLLQGLQRHRIRATPLTSSAFVSCLQKESQAQGWGPRLEHEVWGGSSVVPARGCSPWGAAHGSPLRELEEAPCTLCWEGPCALGHREGLGWALPRARGL